MKFTPLIIIIILCSACMPLASGQVSERAAAASRAASGIAASRAAVQSAALTALARRNAENRARVMAAYARTPPVTEYTRADQKLFGDVIEAEIKRRNANISKEYQDSLAAYTKDMALWQNEDSVFKSARTAFQSVGATGQLQEETLRVDQVVSPSVFLNFEYDWWVELELKDARDIVTDQVLDTDGLVLKVIGQQAYRELATAHNLKVDSSSPQTVRLVKISDGGLKRTPAPERPQPDDPPPDARAFNIGGKVLVCSYIKRLRVKSRKFDVFFAVKNNGKYELAWVPYDQLDKDDQKWLGLEDRRRKQSGGD